jgi:hypothetical protein
MMGNLSGFQKRPRQCHRFVFGETTTPVVRKHSVRTRSMLSPVSFLAVVHCLRTLSLVAFDLLRLACGPQEFRPSPGNVVQAASLTR